MTPIEQVAKALHRNPQTIRVGLRCGAFAFGTAHKAPGSSQYTYTLYPKMVKEYLGIDITMNHEGEEDK